MSIAFYAVQSQVSWRSNIRPNSSSLLISRPRGRWVDYPHRVVGRRQRGDRIRIVCCDCSQPVLADIVAKVPEQMLWNCNLKQSNRGEYSFESTLRACAQY